jgi:nucleotide-binding universal stress UspA family protein
VDKFYSDYLNDHPDEEPYIAYEIQVKEGDAVETILDEANCGKYDLMVIAKRGHGIFYGGLMGDTVRRVLRRCSIPVLVVQAPEDLDSP